MAATLAAMDAILVPGGFGIRGTEGKICAIRYAREHKIPYLGICLGMQLAVVEYRARCRRHERRPFHRIRTGTPYPVIGLITEWLTADGHFERRDENSDLGGSMRLGGQTCKLDAGSLARDIYGKDEIVERHRHRFEVNNALRAAAWKAPGCGFPVARRELICAKWSNCRRMCIPGSWPASSTLNSPPIRAMAIRCSRPLCGGAGSALQEGKAS
jgi:CTP synthase (UTP-ammonia lyase)